MTSDSERLRMEAQCNLYTTDKGLTVRSHALLEEAKKYFVGHNEAVGVLFIDGAMKYPIFIKSGIDGGPWGGTHRGGVPRGKGRGFTSGGPSQGNIATHVEGHASAIMWQRDIKQAHLLVDRAMCGVCHQNLYNTLPPQSILFVYSDAEGKTIVRASHGV
jgi:SCP1.201-like deaminase